MQQQQNVSIDISFVLGFTSNFRKEIEKTCDFIKNYLADHPDNYIEIVAVLQNQDISNRSFIQFTTDLIKKISVVQFDESLNKFEYFSEGVLNSHGNFVFILDFDEFEDISQFYIYRSALSGNRKQVIIGNRVGSSSSFSCIDHKIFRIFKADDDFLITRLMTRESALRIFANLHVTDEFFTVEANRLARIMHMKVKSVLLPRFKKPATYNYSVLTKFTRVFSIGVFYKINVWSYRRMKDFFNEKAIAPDV